MKKSIFTLLISIVVLLGCENDTSFNNDTKSHDYEYVNALSKGAKGNGINDDTEAIQKLLDDKSIKTIYLQENHTFLVKSLIVPSNKTLIIDGTLKVNEKNTYSSSFNNLIYGNNVENIIISGNGIIDGNKDLLQQGYFSLIKFENSNNIEVSIKRIQNNRLPNAKPSNITLGCLYFVKCENVKINDIQLSNWSREGIWLKNTNNSIISNIQCLGDKDSWSGIQVSGENNTINSSIVENAGASGISFDSKYSLISNCIVKNNRFYHGFNFGHKGIPTENTQIINCVSRNSAENGFTFGFSSKDNYIINSHSDNASKAGFLVSNGATNITFNNISAKKSGFGLAIYGATIKVSNADFIENTVPFKIFTGTLGSQYEFDNVKLSSDLMNSSINLIDLNHANSYKPVEKYVDNLTGFQYYKVFNKNVRPLSHIRLEPAHGNTTLAGPFLKEVNSNYFVIGLVNKPENPAWLRFYIQ